MSRIQQEGDTRQLVDGLGSGTKFLGQQCKDTTGALTGFFLKWTSEGGLDSSEFIDLCQETLKKLRKLKSHYGDAEGGSFLVHKNGEATVIHFRKAWEMERELMDDLRTADAVLESLRTQ